MPNYEEEEICREGGKPGVFLPRGGKWETDLPDGFRATIYFIGLAWCFLGVAIVSDIFMSAIETITSKKCRVLVKATGRHRTVKVWNDTVANLTLMALGSSAPEILLSIIELFKEDFHSGKLGPGTIVGSAAFNLLAITAVCVLAIPSQQTRQIKDVSVYSITAIFSMFAYVWLLIILKGSSPSVVSIEEAILTLLFFPVLVLIAFLADKGYLGLPTQTKQSVVAAEMTREELGALIKEIHQEFGDVNDEAMAVLIEKKTAALASKARYRAMFNTSQSFRFSGQPSVDNKPRHFQSALPEDTAVPAQEESEKTLEAEVCAVTPDDMLVTANSNIAFASFASSNYVFSENAGQVKLTVLRSGNLSPSFSIRYKSKEGSAKEHLDYLPLNGKLEFQSGVTRQEILVTIIDDNEWESAEDFYIELLEEGIELLDSSPVEEEPPGVQIFPFRTATVTIIDDDDPGRLCFKEDEISVEESHCDTVATVEVVRKGGSRGKVGCSYRTENGSAVASLDFEETAGRLDFEEGVTSATLEVRIKARGRYESVERFRLVLFNPDGCSFSTEGDGDDTEQTVWIEIKASTHHRNRVERVSGRLSENWDKARIGKSEWQEQFVDAIYVGGSKEEHDEAAWYDWVLHLIALPWKLLFACVPPADFLGGWACFFTALAGIGLLTAVVGDLAALLGCCLQIPELITAITFVALGTSLPDTLASKTAAQHDPYADASIGNITGSNSVNVFLGLGMPWTIAAIYWSFEGASAEWLKYYSDFQDDYPDGGFVVQADGLDFSVTIFVSFAVTCMLFLFIRRKLYGGELGGPEGPKMASAAFLVFLWVAYVGISWAYYLLND